MADVGASGDGVQAKVLRMRGSRDSTGPWCLRARSFPGEGVGEPQHQHNLPRLSWQADLLLLSSSEPHGLCYIETAELDG